MKSIREILAVVAILTATCSVVLANDLDYAYNQAANNVRDVKLLCESPRCRQQGSIINVSTNSLDQRILDIRYRNLRGTHNLKISFDDRTKAYEFMKLLQNGRVLEMSVKESRPTHAATDVNIRYVVPAASRNSAPPPARRSNPAR